MVSTHQRSQDDRQNQEISAENKPQFNSLGGLDT